MLKHPRASPADAAGLSRVQVWAVAALLALAVGAAYHNSLSVPFLFDDLPAIVENPAIRRLWPPGEVLFPEQAGGLTTAGRPLVALSLALNHAIGGYDVAGYHVANVLIHLAAALCLFGVVRRTLLTPVLRARFGGVALPVAACVALLWAVHPLQTAAVTYIVQRAEALVALFYLLTLYAFVRGWFAAGIAACALGMATKEVMVTAPLVVLLYDRTFLGGSFGAAWRRRRRWYGALAATWLILAALVLSTEGRGGTAGFGAEISAWSYALAQCRALVRYAALALWPSPLIFDHGAATPAGLADVFWPGCAVLAALAATVVALRRRPAAGFLGAWFFVILAPSSSFVPIATQTAAEHRPYLPIAAVVTAAVAGAFAAVGRRAILPLAIACGALVFGTVARNRDFRSEVSIWQDTVAKLPTNARAHNNLGQALYRAGRLTEAIASYERAARLNPAYPEPHYNLGVARAGRGDLQRAIAHYQDALRAQPDYPEAHNNLGNALVRAGRLQDALRHYEEAITRRPGFAEAHHNLAHALLQAGRTREAEASVGRALELDPAYADAHYTLGNVMAAAGDMERALAAFARAIALQPDHVGAHVNAGNAAASLGRVNEAARYFEQALAIDPKLADAHYNLGSLALQQERWPEAVARFEAALRVQPDSLPAHRALAFALVQAGRPAAAVPHYERYLARFPDDAEARAELAEARARAGGSR